MLVVCLGKLPKCILYSECLPVGVSALTGEGTVEAGQPASGMGGADKGRGRLVHSEYVFIC